MATPLLQTKLYIPPLRREQVPRPRLIERLDAGLRRKLTLVSAPAGFGKTTLVSEWVHQADIPAAWVSLDPDDNDLLRFWRYAIAALQTIDAGIGEKTQDVLSSAQLQQVSSDVLVTSLINEISMLSTPFILVLDDYHAIGELAVHESLGYLLEHQPSQMHLVVSTREDPPLPLSRLRARGQMTELRASDLRFSETEVMAFLNQAMGLSLASGEIATLETRTEGWIVGLQLAALSLQKQADRAGFLRSFAGDDRHVRDYLVDEVLVRQPEMMQRFLLHTSLLERLCGPLCDAVTGRNDSQTILDHLERTNLFVVPLDNRRYWYRYHHLFAELLRQRLHLWLSVASSSEGATTVEALHLRASRWYESGGFIPEAVSHALASSDFDYAADLIVQYIEAMWDRGETFLVHDWLKALPESVIRSRPTLCIRYAWSVVVDSLEPVGSSVAVVEQRLQDAEKAWAARFGDANEHTAPDSFLGDAAAIRAFLAFRRGDDPTEIAESARRALDRFPGTSPGARTALLLILGRAYRALGNERAALEAFGDARKAGEIGGSRYAALAAVWIQVMMLCLRGRFRQAAEICRDALHSLVEPYERSGRPLPAAGPIHILLGTILAEWGEMDEAECALSRGIGLVKSIRTANLEIQKIGHESLFRLKRYQGKMAEALDIAKQVEQIDPQGGAWAAALRARLWLAQAEHDSHSLSAAIRWADERRIKLDSENQGRVEQITLARLLIAQHRACRQPDLGLLLRFLDGQLQAAEEKGYVWWMIEALILKALALQARKDIAEALSVLERALALAEPERFFLTFVEQGAPMARLLYQAIECGIAPRESYVGRLLAAFDLQPSRTQAIAPRSTTAATISADAGVFGPDVWIEPLTGRELEVLHLIGAGLSNREIAQELFISLSTVKRHTSKIYGKLNVHNRTQAVARARILGILS